MSHPHASSSSQQSPESGHQPQVHAGKRSAVPRGEQHCCKGLRVAPLQWDFSFPFLLWLSCGSISPGLISIHGNSGESPVLVSRL